MRIEWLHRKCMDLVIVFFNGWGMDGKVIAHLEKDADLLMCSDYRSLKSEDPPALSGYREVYVVAWSMGVWAAAHLLPTWKVAIKKKVALNGTERPVDDRFGIPYRTYVLTEKNMDERGREKFFSRMLAGKEEMKRFADQKPGRELSGQAEELQKIREYSSEQENCLHWDRVFISEQDVIFPPESQYAWWKERAPVSYLQGGHYPFYQFKSWREILEY